MTFRSSELGQSGYYVCKKKHKEMKIPVNIYNELITNHLKTILGALSPDKLKKDVFAYLKTLETNIEHKIIVLNRQLKNVHKEMIEKYVNNGDKIPNNNGLKFPNNNR